MNKLKDLIVRIPEFDEKMNRILKDLKNLNLEDIRNNLKQLQLLFDKTAE
jgi:hypothetical protein